MNKELYFISDIRNTLSYFVTIDGKIIESITINLSFPDIMVFLRKKIKEEKYCYISSICLARHCSKIGNASIIDHNSWLTILELISYVEKTIHRSFELSQKINTIDKKNILLLTDRNMILTSCNTLIFISHGFILNNLRLIT